MGFLEFPTIQSEGIKLSEWRVRDRKRQECDVYYQGNFVGTLIRTLDKKIVATSRLKSIKVNWQDWQQAIDHLKSGAGTKQFGCL